MLTAWPASLTAMLWSREESRPHDTFGLALALVVIPVLTFSHHIKSFCIVFVFTFDVDVAIA